MLENGISGKEKKYEDLLYSSSCLQIRQHNIVIKRIIPQSLFIENVCVDIHCKLSMISSSFNKIKLELKYRDYITHP